MPLVASQPLKEPHERFSQLLALGIRPSQAAAYVGYRWSDGCRESNARRLANRKRVRERADYWRRNQCQEILDAEREIIKQRLWLWHETDIGEFYETQEEPIVTPLGEVVRDADGNPLMRKVQRMKPFSEMTAEQRKAIKSLTYTDKGRPNLELYSALDANRDLRKMNGFDAARTLEDGDPLIRLPDNELFAELTRQAAELGVDVKMTFEVSSNE